MNYSSDEDDKPLVFKRSSTSDKFKHSAQQKAAAVVRQEKPSPKTVAKQNSDSEDSEDDKPLSSRISTVPKANSNHVKVGPSMSASQRSKTQVKNEDSDDEKPLSSKFTPKSYVSASIRKHDDSDDDKPLSSKVKQNGSASRDNQSRKPNIGLNKRPPNEENSLGQSSIKKPKLSDSSAPINRKPVSVKPESETDDDENDHVPISQRMKNKAPSGSKSASIKQKSIKVNSSSFKKTIKKSKKIEKNSKYSKPSKVPPGSGEGQKWTSLVHNGVIFPPPYKPHGVKMLYKGKPVDLTPEQEEVATMFAVMLDTDYMTKPVFKENFMGDWRKILGRNHTIQNLDDCDFRPIYEWHQREKEKKKQMSTEEKKAVKEEKMKLEEKYMWAIVDGVKEKVGNFRVEPPGLFRGRGEHPKMGKLKKRIRPSDITINIGKGSPIPECPIPGQSWKEVRHDNTVTWLAYWNDPINPKDFKYVFLAASSSLKGQSDKEKYEKARSLKASIRKAYTRDFGNKDVTKRQVAVATYLIDKLALRAGNEKDDDEADTVGCCTLKVENVEPEPPNILKFDFLGKDSIRYQNEVEVELPVFKAIQQFRTGKKDGDDLFDKLDTSTLNAHLKELMPGLTAKVFRTYNASFTLDDMNDMPTENVVWESNLVFDVLLTSNSLCPNMNVDIALSYKFPESMTTSLNRDMKGGNVAENLVVYNQANKEVAIICNHQRTVSKSHSAQMTRLNEKIEELKGVVEELETDLARAKKGKPPLKGSDGKTKRNMNPEALHKKIVQTNAKIEKMERDKETKEDLKTVALGTSKINYLDPRITVAWCKRREVPIEKVFNKSLLAKFAWAMDVEPSFRF
ncbi:DNA breaking-rejoining enzyme, catalytic core [Cynara cardunculus var. scolymus]|uniref:DNA topoisomerase I n=1 Tax=Cynara cardunculus var. scolymus TaxID=59895 RepID=A0A118JXT4_CYNCS|nr:DNA breaking-rejoining enzyme, catalytic core [Cynara cardunculus var. scolymus]